VKFKPAIVEVLGGGRFTLDNVKSVRELRAALKLMDDELKGWGDDLGISEVHVHKGNIIDVTLTEGITK